MVIIFDALYFIFMMPAKNNLIYSLKKDWIPTTWSCALRKFIGSTLSFRLNKI